MAEGPTGWIDTLPRDRCIAEVSLWSADLLDLGAEIGRIDRHADMLHIDVADGVFAPALLFFPDLVSAICKRSLLPVHVHLMVSDGILLSQTEQFLDAGATLISVHAEASNAAEAIALITARGAAAGLVLRVETPVSRAALLLEEARFLTLLGTAIGVKGQGLHPLALTRLTEARRMLDSLSGPRRVLAADGAIRENTVDDLLRAGAETVVIGSLFFGSADLADRMDWLRRQGRS